MQKLIIVDVIYQKTAVSIALLKYPESRYLNLSGSDISLIKDNSFDAVYNSSMLEHIGFYQEAIIEMARVAKKEVYILFFEGLLDEEQNSIKFYPYTKNQISGKNKDFFGRKIVFQDHIYEKRRGWYWNKYSKKQIVDLMERMNYQYTILDKTNTDFCTEKSILIIKK